VSLCHGSWGGGCALLSCKVQTEVGGSGSLAVRGWLAA